MRIRLFAPLWVGVALLAALLVFGSAVPSSAAPAGVTRYVSPTGNDASNCLTPAAACRTIDRAVALSVNGDSIEIAAGVYNEHDLQISTALTLNGAGAGATIVDAGAAGRVFFVTSQVQISNLTMRNGRRSSGSLFDAGGGAILNNGAGNLTLSDVSLIGNTAVGSGGAIFNIGKLTLENTQVLSNTAQELGGGVYNYSLASSELTVIQSTLAYNTAAGYDGGGAIYNSGKLTLISTTLSNNSAGTFGGGLSTSSAAGVTVDGVTISGNRANSGAALYAVQGSITATNLTISGNTASNNYGGIFVTGSGTALLLKSSTIADNTRTNTAGRGVNGLAHSGGATASLVNTLLSNNEGNNCFSSAPPTSLGNNLSDDFSCGLTQGGDLPGVNPRLGPLGNNAGPVFTHALLSGSPAIDAGSNAQCPAKDARGVSRPYDGDANGAAVCDIGAFEARHRIAIADSSVTEGNSGTVVVGFSVTLAPASATPIAVQYATVNGTATAGSDYAAASGTLTFNPGETQKPLNISVIGDAADEPDETFLVQLSTAANVDLLDAQATGTIVDDDGLSALSVADAAILEGNSGTIPLQFLVTLSPASASSVTVQYATVNGTAGAGSDYAAASGMLTFAPGQTSKTVSINVLGDTVDEGTSESFILQLSNPTNATLADGQATGAITDDDEARLSLQSTNPQLLEGDSGVTPLNVTVSLSPSAAFAVTVNYAASSGVGANGAQAGEDFRPASGTLTFSAGQTSKSFTVQVIGDTRAELDEIFWVQISNGSVPMGGSVTSATILNDDNYLINLPLVLR